MIFQSAMSSALSEIVLRAARNGVTKTVTNTSVTLPIVGGPVVLATATASYDGTYIGPAVTSTSVVNNLFLGLAYDYPELRTSTAARWGGESQGLVQCYGLYATAKMQIATSAQAAGSALIPNVNELISVSGPITAAATSSAAHAEVPALGCLAVLVEAIASSSATATGSSRVFLRCL